MAPLAPEVAVLELRESLAQIEDKIVCSTDDRFLLSFLRYRKFDVKAAFASVLKYYGLRKEFPEKIWPRGRGIQWMEAYAALNNCSVLPRKNPRDNTWIFAWRKGLWKPEEGVYDLADYFAWSLYMTEYFLYMKEDVEDSDGWTCIMDLAGFEARHLPYCDLRAVRTYARILTGALPVRVKAIHFVNVPTVFQFVLKLVKYLLTNKLRSRFFVDESFSNLHQRVDPDVLPVEYGGCDGNFSSRWLYEEMLHHDKEIEERSYYGFK
ncbi:alpha-tocopherol transfer protein-like [Galendromus occidentalis]|uniref:Alpha-tocopherol transfer protein-like n=1 Tax=Galendromus occidentalis TaxID=34638 RepID=A0AAJ6QVN0_9ACAR|nr:alpha-tocopherol transfer protein-like [Galendromus occidentalis]